ncbi:hypothetical protein EDF56_1032 [Novosphingobium sp. PhB165]|uniref:hypothetical protein n=1 Tax=Novosphingobium sp. PhB165 TaxID=2485105 RepID=UPI001044F5D6|nr:hypothetical protein [Novosphingobium sp. PhB165]TCM19367.1 hypothetical protein EDF56_1032 [Novosphingobium sp. PhB165]
MSYRVFPALSATFFVSMLAWSFWSGQISLMWGSYRRDKSPIMFWFIATIIVAYAVLSVLAVIA